MISSFQLPLPSRLVLPQQLVCLEGGAVSMSEGFLLDWASTSGYSELVTCVIRCSELPSVAKACNLSLDSMSPF